MKNSLLYLFLLLSILSYGQTYSGKVLDKETGQPLAFVTVYSVEQQTGSITDEDGQFELTNVPQTLILQLSFVGYETILKTVNVETDDNVFYLQAGHIDLDEVILSAPQSRLRNDNTITIEQRGISALQSGNPLSLAAGLATIPGMNQISTGSGIGKPVIRGLSGSRIVTYVQGIRLENQQWGEEHGLGIGDIGIESVEVIKGPASLLYGSDALGGVLYFVDERYAKTDHIDVTVNSQFLSRTIGTSNQIGLKINRKNVKLNVFGGYKSHADYGTPNNLRAFNTRFNEKNFKAAYGFGSNSWVSNLRYSYLKNNFGITEENQPFEDSTQRNFILPYQTIINHNISWDNTLFVGEGKIKGTLGYTSNQRQEFEETLESATLDMALNSFSYNLKWFLPNNRNNIDWIIGAQGMIQTNTNNGEELLIPNGRTQDVGMFVIGSVTRNQWYVQGGVRFDQRQIQSDLYLDEGGVLFESYENHFDAFNFAFGLAYELDQSSIKLNISSGFRAPNTSELLSNGVHEGTNQYVVGNSALKSEAATQIDIALNVNSTHLDFSFQPFYNVIKNYIYLTPSNSIIDDSPRFDYTQSDAILYGGELGFHYHPHQIHWLHLESDLSVVIAENDEGDSLPLIPAKRWRSTARSEWTDQFIRSIYLTYQYTDRQNRVGLFETKSPSYGLIDVGMQLSIHKNIYASLGITNLFNTNYIDHLSRLKALDVPNIGRNFSAKVTWNLDQIIN